MQYVFSTVQQSQMVGIGSHRTLPETNIAIENPPFWWYLPGNIVIFHGYVSLQEGNLQTI